MQETDVQQCLVLVARDGDRAAYAALFASVAPRVRAYLLRATRGNRLLSEELTQDVMMRVWKRAKSFDPDRGSAMAWIFTIARNARIDHARRKRPLIDDSDPLLVVDTDPGPDVQANERQRADRVRDALGTLPEEQAEILDEAYFSGRSLREIAEATDVPLGTVKSRVRLAFGKLRKSLGEVV